MNHFEYTVVIDITKEEIEKKTDSLFEIIKEGKVHFNFIKMIDEKDFNEKKIRTFVLTSFNNISPIIFNFFRDTNANFYCSYKTPLSMV